MLYFDTSFLVPLILPEKTSEQIEAFFHHLPADQTLVASQWTRVEFASVLSRLVRMGELSKETAGLCNERFSLLLVENFEVVLPEIQDFDLSWRYLTRLDSSLRAGDALHLAIAANMAVDQIITLDEGMIKAGTVLKLPVGRGIS
jgi:uncharacterized protein